MFREFEGFPHKNPHVRCGKLPLLRLLEAFPDAKDQIVSFGIANLSTLTIESVHDLIVAQVVPRLEKVWRQQSIKRMESDGDATTRTGRINTDTSTNTSSMTNSSNTGKHNETFLNAHGIKCICLTTNVKWMHRLGFKYDTRKKSFYVDGHEREEVLIASRAAFCKCYLTEYEPFCKRWVQLPLSEAKIIKGLNLGFCYSFLDDDSGEERIEFHADYWN